MIIEKILVSTEQEGLSRILLNIKSNYSNDEKKIILSFLLDLPKLDLFKLEEITDSATTLDSNNSLNKLDVSSLDAATIKRLMDYQNRKPSVREYKKIGRNDPCPCGSGKKYKKCCLNTGKYENLVKTK